MASPQTSSLDSVSEITEAKENTETLQQTEDITTDPVVTEVKKTLVSTPNDIKIIGLDTIIKSSLDDEKNEGTNEEATDKGTDKHKDVEKVEEVDKTSEENETESVESMEVDASDKIDDNNDESTEVIDEKELPESTKSDSVDKSIGEESEEDLNEETEEVKQAITEKASPKTQNLFCKNLKEKMQRVLQDKKISIVAKKKEQELVIIKQPASKVSKPDVVAGKKIKIMQNQVINTKSKTDDCVNGKMTKIVVKAAPIIKAPRVRKTIPYPYEEGSPVFKPSPMRTYKRKRSESDKDDKVEEKIIEEKVAEKIEVKKPIPALIPKKRGRKSKAELEAIEKANKQFEFDEDDEEMEEIIIVRVPDKKPKKGTQLDDDDNDDIEDEEDAEDIEIHTEDDEEVDGDAKTEEIRFITDNEDAAEEKASSIESKNSYSAMVAVIKKKRGRRSKAELEILEKYEQENKRLRREAGEPEEEEEEEEENDDNDEDLQDEEEEVEEEEEEEVAQMIMSPTRTGRVPKRNKLFDNFVTSTNSRKASTSASESESTTPKPAKIQKKETKSTETRESPVKRRGRPPKSKPVVEEIKVEVKGEDENLEDEVDEGKDTDTDNKDTDKVIKVSKVVDKTNETSAVHVTGDSEVIVIPKKRGRPAPVPTILNVVSKPASTTTSSITTVVKVYTRKVEKAVNKDQEPSKTDGVAKDQTKIVVKPVNNDEDETVNSKEDKKTASKTTQDGDDEDVEEDKTEDKDVDDDEAEVVVVRRGRRGKKPTHVVDPKVKSNTESRGVKRKVAVALESDNNGGMDPSTSTAQVAGCVDEPEPSKKRKVETLNEPVADLGATTIEKETREEGVTTKMYRLLVANLVVNIRERMAAAQDQPKLPGQTVTCAVCKQNMKPNEWITHKLRYHNNITWKTTETPLDLDNHYEVQTTLTKLYPKKPCICEACNDTKKSSLGFLTHKLFCNRTEEEIEKLKVSCRDCSKLLLPNQLVEHDKWHKKQVIKAQNLEKLKEAGDNVENEDGTPRKRNAAKRASQMISQVSEQIGDCVAFVKLAVLRRFFVKNNYNSLKIKAALKSMIEKAKDDEKLKTVDVSIKIEEGTTETMEENVEFKEVAVGIDCIFGCESKYDDITKMYEHFNVCEQKPEKFFICKICLKTYEVFQELRAHIVDNHKNEIEKNDEKDNFKTEGTESNDDEEGEEEDEDDELAAKKTKSTAASAVHSNAFWKLQKFPDIIRNSEFPLIRPGGVNVSIYSKMFEFCETNYNAKVYVNYPFKKSTWSSLNKNYITQYLPLLKRSIAIGHCRKAIPKDLPFKRYKLFETDVVNGVVNIYCGGPIRAMAWAPTDYDESECEQILAVAVERDPDMKYLYQQNYNNKNAIQLWNFGVLNNKTKLAFGPELEVIIAHQYGNVASMDWCPSGCYEVNGTRLGLLAICSTDGHVYCYSIGRSKLLNEKIYKPQPVFKLSATKECDLNFGMKSSYPTKLHWTRCAGHKYIAVAYSNGLVSMFNIQTESELLREKVDNMHVYYPYLTFKADNGPITAISLNTLCNGNRYLVTSSTRRLLKLWDLHSPTLKSKIISKRSCNTQIFWPLNTLTVFGSSDDSSSNAYLTVGTNHMVDIDIVRNTMMLYSHAPERCLTGSDWGGLFLVANDAGEVSCSKYRDLQPFILDVPHKRYVFSNTSIVQDQNNVPLSFNDKNNFKVIQESHKVIFHDYRTDTVANVPKQERLKHELSHPDFSKFPIQAATAMCTNPNRYSFLFNAVGYNIGFVRVFHSNFLNVM